MTPLPPSAGIPGPFENAQIVAALCAAFRAARRAGLSVDAALAEAEQVGRRAAALINQAPPSPSSRGPEPCCGQEAGEKSAEAVTPLARAGCAPCPGPSCNSATAHRVTAA